MCSEFKKIAQLEAGHSLRPEVAMKRSILQLRFDRWTSSIEKMKALEGLAGDPVLYSYWELESSIQRSILELWGENGNRLIEQASAKGSSVLDVVADVGLKIDQGPVNLSEWGRLRTQFQDQFTLRCAAKPAGWTPVESLPKPLKPVNGRLLVVHKSEGRRQLRELTIGGDLGSPIEFPDEEGTTPLLSPDGRKILVTAISNRSYRFLLGNVSDLIFTSLDAGIRRQLPEWGCARWDVSGGSMLVRIQPDKLSSQFVSIEFPSGRVLPFAKPFPNQRFRGCAKKVGESLLVETPFPDGSVGIRRFDGVADEPVFGIPGCTVVWPTPDPEGSKLIVSASCDNAYLSGLYIMNLDGSHPRQLLTGHIAAPTWSPTGKWLAFGYTPLGSSSEWPSLWIADRNGEHAEQIAPAQTSWPAWIS
jgi:hypothetical protein